MIPTGADASAARRSTPARPSTSNCVCSWGVPLLTPRVADQLRSVTLKVTSGRSRARNFAHLLARLLAPSREFLGGIRNQTRDQHLYRGVRLGAVAEHDRALLTQGFGRGFQDRRLPVTSGPDQ